MTNSDILTDDQFWSLSEEDRDVHCLGYSRNHMEFIERYEDYSMMYDTYTQSYWYFFDKEWAREPDPVFFGPSQTN